MTAPYCHEFENPSHPDAIALWPLLLPAYQQLLNLRFDLEASYPAQARYFHRMAEAVRQRMIDAELGLLEASPENRVQRALLARAPS